MAKVIDLKKTVFELVQEHPEVADVLASVGLTDIKDPKILETVGKQLTIPQGTRKRGVALDVVANALKAKGFEVVE